MLNYYKFVVSLKTGTEDKISILIDMLKEYAYLIEYAFINYTPISMKFWALILK